MINITFQPEEERLIQEKLNSGKYATAYEVIVEALRLLEKRDKQYEQWVEETRKKVAIGITQLDRGEWIDGEIVMARLREKLEKVTENKRSSDNSRREISQTVENLFSQTQALPGVQDITEEDIIAEIEAYRRGE
ncbi:MAG: type II toxin-antitoxin system ParD family antitoxin [Desertifilum sp.]|nr:type II toxin-antitoxin system ParD family antitoxin [Desertifilum sp.]